MAAVVGKMKLEGRVSAAIAEWSVGTEVHSAQGGRVKEAEGVGEASKSQGQTLLNWNHYLMPKGSCLAGCLLTLLSCWLSTDSRSGLRVL